MTMSGREDWTSARDDIEATLYRFVRGFDEDDFGLLVDCMTSEVEMTSFQGATSGRDAVLEMLRSRRDAAGADGSQPRHLLGNIEINVESDSVASARAAYVMVSTGPDGVGIVSAGTYGDSFVKERGTWRINRRYVNRDRPGLALTPPAR
jgi:hypothetical protein